MQNGHFITQRSPAFVKRSVKRGLYHQNLWVRTGVVSTSTMRFLRYGRANEWCWAFKSSEEISAVAMGAVPAPACCETLSYVNAVRKRIPSFICPAHASKTHIGTTMGRDFTLKLC
jgi:hypothetical protein